MRPEGIRRGILLAFLLVIAAVMSPVIVQWMTSGDEPILVIEDPSGRTRVLSLADLRRLPALERPGRYQNQFGNWRDEGVYAGVPLRSLLGVDTGYETLIVVATDGYRLEIARDRIEDPKYPMVLAYAFDGAEVPAWEEGPRIAVLPEDGAVSNEDYGVVSAGSFWVRNVARLILE